MNIIEWLFTNPLILFIIIGVISSVFRKKGEEQNQNKQSPQRVPQAGQEQQTANKEREVNWDFDIFGEEAEDLEKKLRDAFYPPKEEKKIMKQETKVEIPKVETVPDYTIPKDSPILQSTITGTEGKVYKHSLDFSKKQVVNGVIWSEILGQSRAQKPYRPVYLERRRNR